MGYESFSILVGPDWNCHECRGETPLALGSPISDGSKTLTTRKARNAAAAPEAGRGRPHWPRPPARRAYKPIPGAQPPAPRKCRASKPSQREQARDKATCGRDEEPRGG